jgi:hypothetical protein
MNVLIKKASAYSSEEQAALGFTGIPQDWPVEMRALEDPIPAGFEEISPEDLEILKGNNLVAFTVWSESLRPVAPPPAPTPVAIITDDSFMKDSEGAAISKSKITASSNTYNQRVVVFETSKLSSIVNKKFTGADWGDATMKFYDANDTKLTTQEAIDSSCVRTVVDWEPLFTYDLIGGRTKLLATPEGYAKTAQIWTVAIPDLPAEYGGSINMIDGRVLEDGAAIVADGRGVKTLPYDAVYHTNKMRSVITHLAGNQLRIEVVFEIYYTR